MGVAPVHMVTMSNSPPQGLLHKHADRQTDRPKGRLTTEGRQTHIFVHRPAGMLLLSPTFFLFSHWDAGAEPTAFAGLASHRPTWRATALSEWHLFLRYFGTWGRVCLFLAFLACIVPVLPPHPKSLTFSKTAVLFLFLFFAEIFTMVCRMDSPLQPRIFPRGSSASASLTFWFVSLWDAEPHGAPLPQLIGNERAQWCDLELCRKCHGMGFGYVQPKIPSRKCWKFFL